MTEIFFNKPEITCLHNKSLTTSTYCVTCSAPRVIVVSIPSQAGYLEEIWNFKVLSF